MTVKSEVNQGLEGHWGEASKRVVTIKEGVSSLGSNLVACWGSAFHRVNVLAEDQWSTEGTGLLHECIPFYMHL